LAGKKHTIAYIVNSLNLGGTENLVVQMSRAFQAEYAVTVICLDEPGLWAQKLRDEGIPVYCFWRQPGIDLAIAGKIARFCKKHTIDLIHAHQCTPWFYAALSRVLYSSPKLLFEEHGRHYPERYSWKKNLINRWFIQNLTTKIVAVSADVRQRLAKYEGITANRIEVIYNGVSSPPPIDKDRRELLRRQLGLKPEDFVIGTVGRLDPIKNIPLLVKALADVHHSNTSIKGLLVGDGPERQQLQKIVVSLNIEEDIVFAGYRKDATDVLQCLDLFVLCSFSEGTSMALLEAMAAGIPAIVTDVGGNPELISNNVNGWVIPTDSPADLIRAIYEALNNKVLTANMVKNGQQRFHNSFTFDSMLQNYGRYYQELTRQA
jgi:L-malate glycosyltransferase